MKVGTDGVLLGAWSSLEGNPQHILDIGAGTGLIALMLAQRSRAEVIDAVEIDENAYIQCVGNFENSPWSDRVFCYHAPLEQFVQESEDKYDLIVSNPPFYSENVASRKKERDLARQTSALPFDKLIKGVAALLAQAGVFCVIVPGREERQFCKLAETSGLYPALITRVRGNPAAPLKRSLIAFQRVKSLLKEEEMVIENRRHEYTNAYWDLTSEFYLRM